MTTTDANLASQSASSTDDDVISVICREFQRWIDLAAQEPTDEQLSKIWPPWNALPPDMIPEMKWRVLAFDENNEYFQNTEQHVAFEKLRRQFRYLPLPRHEFKQALDLATHWSKLLYFLETTRAHYQDIVTRQWAFVEADAQAPGRIAIFRAAREIELTHPDLFKSTNPTVADITLLGSRYAVYDRAREAALAALEKLLYKVPGMRTGKPLPLPEVALGVPNPPDDVPRYRYIARLDALGLCSEKRLNQYLREEYPNLTKQQKRQFDRIRRKPHFGKEPYAAFLIWVLDNRPIFERPNSQWQWNDILTAAEGRNIDCPKTGLKQWACRSGVKLKVKRGQPGVDNRGPLWFASLLSPSPVFEILLKQAGA